MNLKDYIYNFLNVHPLAVMSTVQANGGPQAAVVGFGQTKDLEILIGTYNSSRKYKNLTMNSAVALVIGWDNGETIQYEGNARKLRSDELDLIRDNYWVKNPQAEAYHQNSGERYFIITPTWIRYTDLKVEPWDIKELKF
jgi:pyridoxine/pyridoxamine 5'-phosphate oxidase